MSHKDVHYEVFLKKNAKASWALVEARPDREGADALVKTLTKAHPTGSIRMTREQYEEDSRAFRTLTILEKGPDKFADPVEKKGDASIPCMTPDDLVGPAARDTIRRTLAPWLERYELTPMELLHRPDMVEKLDSADTDLQHAVQKFAVIRAQNSDASVHSFIRLINELVQKAIEKARKEEERVKKLPKGSFSETADKAVDTKAPSRLMRLVIAHHLKTCRSLMGKVELIVEGLSTPPVDASARELMQTELDTYLAEILTFDRGMKAITGALDNPGTEVSVLTAMFEGKSNHKDLAERPKTSRTLARHFSSGSLEGTKSQIATRILDILRSPKRLKPKSVMDEIELSRQLAQRLIAASGPSLHPDALVEAFTHRSARLLSPESIYEALKDCENPAEAIESLLAMEDNIVGEGNKKKLASYVRARVTSHGAESWFCKGPGQPLHRLIRLTTLQKRTLEGTFPMADKVDMANAFDQLGLKIIAHNELFDRIRDNGKPALTRAITYLRLAVDGYLPQGECLRDAHARAIRILGTQEGREEASRPESARQLKSIQDLVKSLSEHLQTSEDDQEEDGKQGEASEDAA